MTCTESAVDSQAQVGLDVQPQGLRVRYPDGREEKLSMPSVKATLGSGAGCTVLIRHPGVGPLHCMLFPSPTGWRVRRWSAGTLLNGELFAEAPLEAGDRLQLGPVEIEFLAEPPRDRELAVEETTLNEQVVPAIEQNDALADRAAFEQTLAEHLRRLEELAQKLDETATQQRDSQREQGELREQLHDIRHELAHAEQLHVATRDAIVELQRQIIAARQTPVPGRSSSGCGFRKAQRMFPASLRRRLSVCSGKTIAVSPVGAEQASAEVSPVSSLIVNESSPYNADPWTAASDRNLVEPLAVIAEVTQGEAEFPTSVESETIDVQEEGLLTAEPQEAATPESFLEKYKHLLREDETPTEAVAEDLVETLGEVGGRRSEVGKIEAVAEDLVKTEAPVIERPAPPASLAPAASDEDSIESYMAGLLQRVRGETSPVAKAIVPRPSDSAGRPSVSLTTDAQRETETPIEQGPRPVTDLAEIKPGPAPERSHDMAALRDLANQSARGHIQTAELREHRESALVKLMVSSLAIVCGLIVMKFSPSYKSPEFIGGLVPIIAGLVWGGRTIMLLLCAIRDGSIVVPFIAEPSSEAFAPVSPDVSADDL